MKNNIHVLRLALGSRRKIKQIPNLVGDDYITFLNMIHLHDKTFEPFISSDEIDFAISNIAKQMDDDFFDEIFVYKRKTSLMPPKN